MDIQVGGRSLREVGKFNVIIGKNGSGKSTLLRLLETNTASSANLGIARYITPERGGELTYQGQFETNISQNPRWADEVRRNNRYENFRQLSVVEFRRLEALVLRKIEKDKATRDDHNFTFETIARMKRSEIRDVP